MKRLDDPQVHPWIDKMNEDLEAISALQAKAPHLHAVICFHAQQAAEKALKACVVSVGKKVLTTHNLFEILDLLVGSEMSQVDSMASDCALLSRYAVLTRYPMRRGPGPEDEVAAVEACARIVAVVRKLLAR